METLTLQNGKVNIEKFHQMVDLILARQETENGSKSYMNLRTKNGKSLVPKFAGWY